MGPSRNGPRLLAIRRCCTHCPVVNCVWYQAYTWRVDGRPCMIGCYSDNCRNKIPTCTPPPWGRPRSPTDLRIKTNMNRHIVEASEAALLILQVTHHVVFHQDALVFTQPVLTGLLRRHLRGPHAYQYHFL